MNLANLITLLRFPLLVVVVLLLYFGGWMGQLAAASLTVVLIVMDSLDGNIARRRQEVTLIGSALDIAADRTVEIVLWIAYGHLGLISIVISMIVVLRGMLTDSIRNVALSRGYSAHRMMRSPWSKWLVASPFMRTGYAVVKATAFTLLAVALGLRSWGLAAWRGVWIVASISSWLSLAFCIVRGMPVLVDAEKLFGSHEFQDATFSPSERGT
jgi:phosphatidylglycerophosphate synthase